MAKTPVKRKSGNHAPVPLGTLVIIGGKENKGVDGPNGKKKPSDFFRLEVLKEFKEATRKRSPVYDEVQELGGEIKVTMGLEFLKDVCIDTHFVHRGRLSEWHRLLLLILPVSELV